MIINKFVFPIKADLKFVEGGIPQGYLTANDINKDMFYVISPAVGDTIVSANFQNNVLNGEPVKVEFTPSSLKVSELVSENESYYELVKDWNVWQGFMPSKPLEYVAYNRAGEIGISFNLKQLLVPPIPHGLEVKGFVEQEDFVPTQDGVYVVKVAYYEYDNVEFTYHDLLIKDGNDVIRKGAMTQSGNTGSVEYAVDPSVYDSEYESLDPSLTESILSKLGENSADIKLLSLKFNDYYTIEEVDNKDTAIMNEVNDLDERIDNIIVGTIEGASAQEIIDARQGEVTLGANIAKVKSQKADISYVNQQVQAVSLAFKESYETLADLQTAYPTGDAYNHVVLSNGMIYTWSKNAWVNTNIQANGTGIPDNSVTVEKVTFVKTTTNLFNSKTSTKGYYISSVGEMVANSQYDTSDFIDTEPFEWFTSYGLSYAAYYDNEMNFIGRATLVTDNLEGYEFSVPTNSYYMRVMWQKSLGLLPQLNRGTTLLPYEEGFEPTLEGVKVELDEETVVSLQETVQNNIIGKSSNIYDERTKIVSYAISSQSGELVVNDSYETTPFYTIDPSQKWTSKLFNRVAFYDENKTFISMINILPEKATFTTPINSVYMRLHKRKAEGTDAQLNKGEELLPYEPYYIEVDGYKIGKDILPNQKPYYFAPVEIGSNLILSEGLYTYPTVEQLYENYDTLISNHPDYITKKILGKDTTGNYDIWELHLKPKEYDGTKFMLYGGHDRLMNKRPKITFIAGIHGHEQGGILAAYYMTKALCEEWQTNEALEYLRHNVEFKFIPLVYPHGYVTDLYSNVTGVNLQTNFPYNWYLRDEESNVYGGTEPLSEIETVYCKNLIDENTDSFCFIDVHSFAAPGNVANEIFYYLISREEFYNEDMEIAIKYAIESISRLLQKNYPVDSDDFLGWIQLRDGRGTADAYAESLGITSFVVEVPMQMPYDAEKFSSDANKVATEVFINSILSVLRRFKEVY